MKLFARPLLNLVLLAALAACAQKPLPADAPADALPLDGAVLRERLDSGLSVYLRRNAYPEKRVSLQLVVKAGSLMETESERGLAHFVEHMAFNGTRHFPKNALVAELEAMGVEFGSHVNAFTSYGETIYQLTVPTDKPENLDKALTILRDWADGIAFSEAEVVKERGVVLEEWRSRKGVAERLQDQILPLLYAGTPYLSRKPIGEPAIIQNASAEALAAFYRRWYQPERMALVAVGDLEPAQLREAIDRHFADLPAKATPPAAEPALQTVSGLRHATVLDPENPATTVELSYAHPEPRLKRSADYRYLLSRELALSILNERLEDELAEDQGPWLAAGVDMSPLDRRMSLYTLAARTTPEQALPAFAKLQRALSRALALGVSADELARHKADYLAGLTQSHKDRERIESDAYAGDYVEHFLSGEHYLSVEEELAQSRAALARLAPADIQAVYRRLFAGPDRLALVSGQQAKGIAYPEAGAVAAALSQAAAEPPKALAEAKTARDLLKPLPEPGRLAQRRDVPELGLTELRYANGLTVLLKPTDFQQTEILMQGWSRGGLSQVPDAQFRDAAISADLVAQSGFGAWSLPDLKKLTAGQLLSLSPYVSETEEGVTGSSQPEDLETLLQLTHLAFTAPRRDPAAFAALRGRLEDYARTRKANSAQRFEDAVRQAYTQDHPRYRPWETASIAALSQDQALKAYGERFADAGDFQFILVGRFEVDAIQPLLDRYLGSLPDRGRREQAKDLGARPLRGQHRLALAEAAEPRTLVRLLFSGPARWEREELYLYGSLRRILETRLRQEIRENLSGVYDISLAGELSPYPQAQHEAEISFICDPARAAELTEAVRRVIATLRREGVRPEEIATVRAAQAQEFQARRRDNSAWLNALKFYREAGWDERSMLLLDFERLSPKLTAEALQRVARDYFGLENSLLAQLTPAASPAGTAAAGLSPEHAKTRP